jgi:hypothetical protein
VQWKGVDVRKRILILIGAVVLLAAPVAKADQTSVERQLKENKDYIEFMNVCVTNFGDKQQEKFSQVYEQHFNADISFLQSDYKRAFRDIYQSQKKQTELFTDILTTVYLEDSKMILDRIAPGVIKSKNSAARLYLALAYRDRAMCRSMQIMGDAQNPRLYSAKITRYMESIKLARRSMRFGYLALFQSRDAESKKYIYAHLLEIEREKGTLFYNRFLNKTGDGFVQELNRTFEEYEQEYQKSLTEHDTTAVQPADTAKPAAAKEPVFEKKVEREVRFRLERKVAEYLRDAEFGKAEDLMYKYVDDFGFKLIQATLEVTAVKEKDTLALNWDTVKIHHADNAGRMMKPSYLDSIAGNIKVTDDIKKKPSAQAPSAEGVPNQQQGTQATAVQNTSGQTQPAQPAK